MKLQTISQIIAPLPDKLFVIHVSVYTCIRLCIIAGVCVSFSVSSQNLIWLDKACILEQNCAH